MSPRHVVIVGNGMAGSRLAERIRGHEPDPERLTVTVVGAEVHHAYNRVLLSAVLAGTMTTDAVRLADADWASRHAIDLRLGTSATAVDRAGRTVCTSDGARIGYDALVLATGSSAWLPPVDGLLGEDGSPATRVSVFRDLDDCARILRCARPGAPVAVLGGGLLGLEAARGLAGRGCLVTVVHPNDYVLGRQVDAGAGQVLAEALGELGVEFRLGATARRYVPGDGLKLDDGSHVPADFLVVSAGVRAETGLAVDAGLHTDPGIVVDDALRTSDPRIHAIGDCAQHPGAVSGLVQPAWEQAEMLAMLLTGADGAARYTGTAAVTRLKARGVDLAAMGEVHVAPDVREPEVICLSDPARGRYAKLVLRDDTVRGAILLGVPDAAATVTQHFDSATPVPEDRLGFLLGRSLPAEQAAVDSPATMPGSVVVCRCNGVDKSTLVRAWQGGARGPDELASQTRASTGCGSCRGVVEGIAGWLAKSGD